MYVYTATSIPKKSIYTFAEADNKALPYAVGVLIMTT